MRREGGRRWDFQTGKCNARERERESPNERERERGRIEDNGKTEERRRGKGREGKVEKECRYGDWLFLRLSSKLKERGIEECRDLIRSEDIRKFRVGTEVGDVMIPISRSNTFTNKLVTNSHQM